ncbi:fasciclin domain-containing protein [Maribacter aestuarii]|uniref:fasciclin domain-containing protein n=1 Tax=Maribacter aestuarii TaxID=1130723 RepID=UPI00248C22E3|nr:fasciclin domain-containing protein [Maribacter aestuarii]
MKKTNMKKGVVILSGILSLSVLVISCGDNATKSKLETKGSVYSTSLDFERSVMQILDQSPVYNSFLKLVNAASFFDEIKEMNNIIVFVPTDEAFGPSKYAINDLTAPDSLYRLPSILKYHFVESETDVETLISSLKIGGKPMRLKTLHGGFLALRLENNKLKILDESGTLATVSSKSIRGSNGIVYTIDKILEPRSQMNMTNSTK